MTDTPAPQDDAAVLDALSQSFANIAFFAAAMPADRAAAFLDEGFAAAKIEAVRIRAAMAQRAGREGPPS
jgi:hypothetical protein